MDNAFTGADFTDYFEVINRDHLDVPIGLEADRMANFDPKGFASELAVVEEERRMRTDDNPEDALSEAAAGAGLRRASLPLAGDRLDAGHPAPDPGRRAQVPQRLLLAAKRDRGRGGRLQRRQGAQADLRILRPDQERPQAAAGARSRTASAGRAETRATPCGQSAGLRRGLSRAQLSRRRSRRLRARNRLRASLRRQELAPVPRRWCSTSGWWSRSWPATT